MASALPSPVDPECKYAKNVLLLSLLRFGLLADGFSYCHRDRGQDVPEGCCVGSDWPRGLLPISVHSPCSHLTGKDRILQGAGEREKI